METERPSRVQRRSEAVEQNLHRVPQSVANNGERCVYSRHPCVQFWECRRQCPRYTFARYARRPLRQRLRCARTCTGRTASGDWPDVSLLTLSAQRVRNASLHGPVQCSIGNNTRCKHAMLSGECVENAPEEQVRVDHEMATFRRNARRASLSFFACTMADGSA